MLIDGDPPGSTPEDQEETALAIRPGLCSVTFRQLCAGHLTALAAEAGLQAIEWGGDVHAPPWDLPRAVEVARTTADAGLETCSYGSYFRADQGEEIAPVLDTAEALGARRVRVWAGRTGSAKADAPERERVIERLADAAEAASARGIALALEYHDGTLADRPSAMRSVCEQVPGLSAYWQPAVGAPDDVARSEYLAVSDLVSAVHVFSWWPAQQRNPLVSREGLWRDVLAAAAVAARPPRDALLEFVPGDDPALLATEATTLRRWIDASAG